MRQCGDDTPCVKCGSGALFLIPATPSDHSHIVVGDRPMRNVRVCRRVCTDCGFVEEWVDAVKDLASLKGEYARGRVGAVTDP